MRALVALVVLLSPVLAQPPATPRAIEVLREFDRIGAQPLWPGFEPGKTAVELFDGSDTYLFHHPQPPEGFVPVANAPGIHVFPGQHDSVRANTGTELKGVPTATADISKSKASVREQAALLIHESFHVYEKLAHPQWAANEGELFLYPFDNAEALALRRMETLALVRALATQDYAPGRCWAELALEMREKRFAKMPPGAVAYERGTELNEGLAQYVEYKAIRKPAALPADDFPLELIRQRGYATGQALALLLERFASGPAEVGTKSVDGSSLDSLDEVLRHRFLISSVAPMQVCRAGLEGKEAEARSRANQEVAELTASRARRLQEFLSAPGWRIEIIAGKEPLWPQGFDPWNVVNLGGNAVLHTRWMKVGNSAGSIEALNHSSLTEGVGPHPLFNGARRLVVTGLEEPKVTEAGGRVSIEVAGAKGTFTGKVERTGQVLLIKLP